VNRVKETLKKVHNLREKFFLKTSAQIRGIQNVEKKFMEKKTVGHKPHCSNDTTE